MLNVSFIWTQRLYLYYCFQLRDALNDLFPKLKEVTGGWLLFKPGGVYEFCTV